MTTIDTSFVRANGSTLEEGRDALRQHGVLVLPRFVCDGALEALHSEFSRLFEREVRGVTKLDYSPGQACRLTRDQLDPTQLPSITTLFSLKFMSQLVASHCGPGSELNSVIFATHDIEGATPTCNLHFDKMFGFKFYLYLTEASLETAALEFVPGSHREGRARIERCLRRGVHIEDLPNQVPEYSSQSIPLEGPAGTLVIFDSRGFHCGGTVAAGHERKVLRGHCLGNPAPTYNPNEGSPQWCLENRPNSPEGRAALDAFIESLNYPFR